MFDELLWTIDTQLDGHQFERLCVDLLFQVGYPDIVPVGGTHDRGRDAEMVVYASNGSRGRRSFFQFSLSTDWKRKLLGELKKVKKNGHVIDDYVFVTSQTVMGAVRDELSETVLHEYGWSITIYDREWLRLQLSQGFPEIAQKYLGIPSSDEQSLQILQPTILSHRPSDEHWILYEKGDYDGAVVAFRDLLAAHPSDSQAWEILAWCQYRTFRYLEALYSINRAVQIDGETSQRRSIKACILAEDGIATRSRANLLEARAVFEVLAKTSSRSVDHYNFANTLSALGEYTAAVGEYKRAVVRRR